MHLKGPVHAWACFLEGVGVAGAMTHRAGPIRRAKDGFLAWTKDKVPPLHRFLTSESKAAHNGRSLVSFAVIILLGVTLLWGGTGQPLGEPPVVVIESGSMMHCDGELGQSLQGDACEASSFGRIGTIDPGDLVFVRDVEAADDVKTFADDGRNRHGLPGDVIVFTPNGNEARTPVIHRAMFTLEVHGDGEFSIPEYGLSRVSRSDISEHLDGLRAEHGVSGGCALNIPGSIGPGDSGFITKGDNNNCYDQNGPHGVSQFPIRADWILGKARGEVPWIGMLKLWTFDLFDGRPGGNYQSAPGDLKVAMWVTIAVLLGAPYAVEMVLKRRRGHDDE